MDKLLILLPIGLLTLVQLLLKWQAITYSVHRSNLRNYLSDLATSPWIWCALLLAGSAFVAWMIVLKKLPLSFAYPFISLTFPLVVLGSVLIFGEKVSAMQVLGLVLIVVGVSLYVRFSYI